MHPQPFVAKLVAEGKAETIAQMVRAFSDRLYVKKCSGHEQAYAFSNAFLIGVVSQLRSLNPGQSLDDDNLLCVWKDLGLFGIDRDDINAYLGKDD